MKAISIFLQVVLVALGIATVTAFLAEPSFSASKYLFFGLGLTSILWWVAINLYKQTAPNIYLPKAAIFFGALLSLSSIFYLLSVLAGQNVNLSLLQILAGLVGGVLIIRHGKYHQTLNK